MTFSPRLWQIQERNPYVVDDPHHATDVCIVWWGIAWVMTAYMLLMHTSLRVTIVESGRLAHGATWHNAGQAAAYFEKPFDEIVAEYGYDQAWAGQEALIAGRELLEEIILQEQLTVPYEQSTWYAAWSSLDDLIEHLRRKHLRDAWWVVFDSILVSKVIEEEEIPHLYKEYVTFVTPEKLANLLQTDDTQYIAAWVSVKWTVNSALLCEELVLVLRTRFHERFQVAEHTHVHDINFEDVTPLLQVQTDKKQHAYWYADYVILCTNGYKNFTLTWKSKSLTERFTESRYWIVGYMIWAFFDWSVKSTCISYFPTAWESLVSGNGWDIYYYMTVRHFSDRWLVCLWWPEKSLESISYEIDKHVISRKDHQNMVDFLQRTRRVTSISHADFTWHGLMWYTKTGIREIWFDPYEDRLIYNLWCNGVGICSSVYGAWKIMKLLQWEMFSPSIFDVRC